MLNWIQSELRVFIVYFQGQWQIKPRLAGLLASSEVYCQACRNMFGENASQWSGNITSHTNNWCCLHIFLKLPFRSQLISFTNIIINASYDEICVEFERKTTQHCLLHVHVVQKILNGWPVLKIFISGDFSLWLQVLSLYLLMPGINSSLMQEAMQHQSRVK